jgi:hypothetical protein
VVGGLIGRRTILYPIRERPYTRVKIQISEILKEDGGMNNIFQNVKAAIVVFSIFALMVTCTKIQYIQVDYRLPPELAGLKGRKVLLSFQDKRNPKDIIGAGAKSDYKNFSNNFSYSLARGTEEGFKIGVFDLNDLFIETFTNRLENSGLIVLKEKGEEEAEVVIVLNEFLLDRVKLTWKFSMAYEARLVKEGAVVTTQMKSGKGERLKLVGRKEADKVVGEIFTDMVNRWDVERFFQEGGF